MTCARNNRGFTLIELIVAVGIFVTSITIISSQFILFLQNQRVSLELTAALENSRNVLERIARTVRVSVIVTDDIDTPSDTLCILHPRRGYIVYKFDAAGNGTIEEVLKGQPDDEDDPLLNEKCNAPDVARSQMNSTDVKILNTEFRVVGVGAPPAGNEIQPLATIMMHIQPKSLRDRVTKIFYLQTSVSQRCLEQHTLCVTK